MESSAYTEAVVILRLLLARALTYHTSRIGECNFCLEDELVQSNALSDSAYNTLGYARWMNLCHRYVNTIEARAREQEQEQEEQEVEDLVLDIIDFPPFPEESDFIPTPLTPSANIPEDWDFELLCYENLPFQYEL